MAERESNRGLSSSAGNQPDGRPSPGTSAIGRSGQVGAPAVESSYGPGARTIGLCLLLLALVAWAFLPSLRNGFVDYDDNLYVYENIHVRGGLNWKSIEWAFANLEAGFWHPLTWLTILVDTQLYGLRAWGHHLTSLLLHAASTVLLFLALQRMTRATWRSAIVAALFGLHPLHVEAVAWAAERKEVLSGFFWVLALLMYARYAQKCRVQSPATLRSPPSAGLPGKGATEDGKSKGSYALALAFFVCGLMSKPMIVTLPLMLLLLDWWPLQRFSLSTINHDLSTIRRLLWEKVPFLVAAFVCGVVTIYAARSLGALRTATRFPLPGRFENAVHSYVCYLKQTFWPAGMAVFYPYPQTCSVWRAVGLGLSGLVIAVLLLWPARKRPYLVVGWLWYLVTLLPVIGLIQVGEFSRADRFTYVPLIGVFLLLVWGVAEWSACWRYRTVAVLAMALTAVTLCTAFTRRQIGFWKDDESLWRRAVEVAENSDLTHYNLGVTLASKGAFDEAIPHLEKAIQLGPERADAHTSLAYALLRVQRCAEAIHEYKETLRLNPKDVEAHNNLGNLLLTQKQDAEAVQHFTEALRLNANYPEAHYNLGVSLARHGRYPEAAARFREVLRLNPNHPRARRELDRVLAAQWRFEQATEPYRQALRSNPSDARAHGNLSRLLLDAGQLDEGINQCAEAARLDPRSAEIQYLLGTALARKGEAEKAGRQFELALELDPNFATAHYALGILCQQQRRVPEALKHWRQAARLAPQWPDPLNNLAWALASNPNPELRDGLEAVKLAQRAIELAGTNNVRMLDTLAAAYAEAGRFAEATATARQARAAATQVQADLVEQIQQRLALYGANQPYREEPVSK